MDSLETVQGAITTQSVYASKIEHNLADIFEQSNVLYVCRARYGLRENLANEMNYKFFGTQKYFVANMSSVFVVHLKMESMMLPYYVPGKPFTFTFKSNSFNHFVIDRLLDSNSGVKLKNLYYEYRKTNNLSTSKSELIKLKADFCESVKDMEMVLLRNQHINPFTKLSYFPVWNINSV